MFSHLCRLCLTQFNHPSEIVPLFEPHENVLYYPICNELQLLVRQDDRLGCNVCRKCSETILQLYSFVLTYRESDRKLREMLKSATVAVDEIIEYKPNIEDFVQQVQHEGSVALIKTELEDCDNDTKHFTPKTPVPDPIAVRSVEWKCSICSAEFKNRRQLRRHIRSHHQLKRSQTISKTHPLQCTICTDEFTYKEALDKHRREQHSNGTPDENHEYECDVCSKRFITKKKIRHHLMTHSSESRRKFLCVACGNQFLSKFGLLQHTRTVHEKEQRFHCTLCDRRFAHKHNLKTHMNRHNGHRPYPCTVCDKAFYDSSTLNVHTKSVHSGTNAHVCHICSKGFNRKGNLNVHVVKTHHIQQSKLHGGGAKRVIKKVEVKIK